ncbi:MAG TPA: type II toxin-antitoxin system prevent-host-death family antitoxin [Terriglobales bacterium]|jgi:prevent-host-death family protein
MKTVQASEAKTHFLRLLDEVEDGEEIVITRHGRVIGRILPEEKARQRRFERATAAMEEIRRHTKPVTIKEMLAWRHEGHRY